MTGCRSESLRFNIRTKKTFLKKSLLHAVRCLTLVLFLFFALSCGRKSPPTLKAYEKPEAPAGLSAVHIEDRIMLSWSYQDGLKRLLKGFHVLRSNNGAFKKIAFVANDKTIYADHDFIVGDTYGYKIVAESLKGVSSDGSNVITVPVKAAPSPPDDIRFRIEPDFILMSWKSSGEGICYNIYRTFEKGRHDETPVNKDRVCAPTFKDTELFPERTVYYSIRALLNTDIKDEGYASGGLEIKPSDFALSTPADLRITPADAATYLVWEANPEPWVKGYRVFIKIEGEEEFRYLGEARVPAFIDSHKRNKKLFYMIKAFGSFTESSPLFGETSAADAPAH